MKFTTKNLRLVIKGSQSHMAQNAQGINTIFTEPAVTLDLKTGTHDTKDLMKRYHFEAKGVTEEFLEKRLRDDLKFGVPEGILEITEDDLEEILIKERKNKEAEEEIKEKRKSRKK